MKKMFSWKSKIKDTVKSWPWIVEYDGIAICATRGTIRCDTMDPSRCHGAMRYDGSDTLRCHGAMRYDAGTDSGDAIRCDAMQLLAR